MLSKTSYPQELFANLESPVLVNWGLRAVYIGPGFQLPAHRNAVAVLALALKGTMSVALNARDLGQGLRVCRSVLIEPNQLHLIQTSCDDHAFIYVDALSRDLVSLRAGCQQPGTVLHFDFDRECKLIELLTQVRCGFSSWGDIQEALAGNLGFTSGLREPRIDTVLQALESNPDDSRQVQDWAKEVGLSSSRFQHLFKHCTGVSFRRFRLWMRLRFAVTQVMKGSTLTDAAMAAGMSSSAHLSAAFKTMFGISPSQLINVSPRYIDC
jgi:AraC-like DNA-binding protein